MTAFDYCSFFYPFAFKLCELLKVTDLFPGLSSKGEKETQRDFPFHWFISQVLTAGYTGQAAPTSDATFCQHIPWEVVDDGLSMLGSLPPT